MSQLHIDTSMLSPRFLITIIALLSVLPWTKAYYCTPPRSLLPTPKDCHELIDALESLSRLPPFNAAKTWSRNVEDTVTTQQLPKDYWVQGRGPSTCAIHIDIVPYGNINAEDSFDLRSVANAGEIVIEQCLVRRRNLGTEYPGRKENIQVRIVRTDAPWLKGKITNVTNVLRLGNGTSLFVATDKPKKHGTAAGADIAEER